MISWPVGSLTPFTGIDFSFAAGLHMAVHEGLQFGTQVVGTYGPLGFLRYPFLYYTWEARFAVLYTGGVHLLLCIALVWSLRRIAPTVVAFAIAWLAVAIIAAEPESALVVVVIGLIEAVRADSSPRLKRAFPILAGVVGGMEVLVKVNTGATIAALAVLTVVVVNWRAWRALASFAGAFVATFAVFWFATGQGFGNIGSYISNSEQVVSGWSNSMQLAGTATDRWLALIAALAVAAVAIQAARDESRKTGALMLLIWLVLGFSVWKEGFIAQEPGHESIYFGTALGAIIAFSWPGRQRASVLWSLILLVAIWARVNDLSPLYYVTPSNDVDNLVSTARTMVSAGRRDSIVAQARGALTGIYALDPKTLAELRGKTVTVVPSEQTIIWAYELKWLPTPVFEWYYSVTPALDELNARVLASTAGPQRILQNVSPPVNGRNNLFDSPAAQRSMLCHYVPLSNTGAYEVLKRTGNRCGVPHLMRTVTAAPGTFVAIPQGPAGDLVFVRIYGAAPDDLETLLWRSGETGIRLIQGRGGPARDFRIVPDTMSDGLIMHVPIRAGYQDPFEIDPAATEVAVGTTVTPRLIFRFYEQAIKAL